MAEKNTQTLDNLNQNNLGDKKLSKEEISYIQSKDQLWFKDIGEKLFDDIVSTNEKLLNDNTALKSFIDDIILQPETLRQIAQKAGISLGKVEKMFSDGNQNLDNKTNKYYVVVNLLLYGCTKNIFPEVRGNLIDNINKPVFTGATAKALHKFQKMGENTQGRSKADCVLGPKTLQQMLSYLGVQTVNQKVDAMTFARSNMSTKETYEWNAEQKKQMDIIINDPILTEEQKVEKIFQVVDATKEIGQDGLNKKYGAVSYALTRIADCLIFGKPEDEKLKIVNCILPYQDIIKKYWNTNAAKQYGVNPNLIPKTDDFVKDILDRNRNIETSRVQFATSFATIYLQYMRELTKNHSYADHFTDRQDEIESHCKIIENELEKLQYAKGNLTEDFIKNSLLRIISDPQSVTTLKIYEHFKKNGLGKDNPYIKYYTAWNAMKQITQTTSLWNASGKELFLNNLRVIDKQDQGSNYETTDAIADNITNEVGEVIDKKGNQKSKEILISLSAMNEVDENGNYKNVHYSNFIASLERKDESGAREYLAKCIPGLKTNDGNRPDWLSRDDFVEDILGKVKDMKNNEEKQKSSIMSGLYDEKKRLESMKDNSTLNKEGETRLAAIEAMLADQENTKKTIFQSSMSAMIDQVVQRETLTQILDNQTDIFVGEKGTYIDIYANIVGAGKYISDNTAEYIEKICTQAALELAIACVSFGAANAALRIARGAAGVVVRKLGTKGAEVLLRTMSKTLVGRGIGIVGRTAVRGYGYAVSEDFLHGEGWTSFMPGLEKIASRGVMIGILGRLNKLKELGTAIKTGKIAPNSSIVVKSGKIMTNVLARGTIENVSIGLTDATIDKMMGDGNYTFDEFMQSIAMGLAFEGMQHIKTYKLNDGSFQAKDVHGNVIGVGTATDLINKFANQSKEKTTKKMGEKIEITRGGKKHNLTKVDKGEYEFTSDNGGFAQGERVNIKKIDGKLEITRANGDVKRVASFTEQYVEKKSKKELKYLDKIDEILKAGKKLDFVDQHGTEFTIYQEGNFTYVVDKNGQYARSEVKIENLKGQYKDAYTIISELDGKIKTTNIFETLSKVKNFFKKSLLLPKEMYVNLKKSFASYINVYKENINSSIQKYQILKNLEEIQSQLESIVPTIEAKNSKFVAERGKFEKGNVEGLLKERDRINTILSVKDITLKQRSIYENALKKIEQNISAIEKTYNKRYKDSDILTKEAYDDAHFEKTMREKLDDYSRNAFPERPVISSEQYGDFLQLLLDNRILVQKLNLHIDAHNLFEMIDDISVHGEFLTNNIDIIEKMMSLTNTASLGSYDLKKFIKLTPEHYQNINKNFGLLQELGVKPESYEWRYLGEISTEGLQLILLNKSHLHAIGLEVIPLYNIERLSKGLSRDVNWDNLMKTKDILKEIGIDMNDIYIPYDVLSQIPYSKLEILLSKKDFFQSLGFELNASSIDYFVQIPQNTLDILLKNSDLLKQYKITAYEMLEISKMDISEQDFEMLRQHKDIISHFKPNGIEVALSFVKGSLHTINGIYFGKDIVSGRFSEYGYKRKEVVLFNTIKMARILETLDKKILSMGDEGKKVHLSEVLEFAKQDLLTLPLELRLQAIKKLSFAVNNLNTVIRNLDFNNGPYKNKLELIGELRGLSPEELALLSPDIIVDRVGASIMIYCTNDVDYKVIFKKPEREGSGGFKIAHGGKTGLNGVIVSRSPKSIDGYGKTVEIHEYKHHTNDYIGLGSKHAPKTRAIDEILAYYTDGSSINKIRRHLTDPHGLYNYFNVESSSFNKDWADHVGFINKQLEVVKSMENIANLHPELGITKETIVNMLTVTWYQKREILEKSLRDIVNNPLNMKDNIWWTNTYSHELALKDISNANNLQSLGKILLDPKLEHISFGTTTKYSGRNIRGIVTEYRAGNMTIDYVPRELRDKVKELCQKEPILEGQSINK